MSTNCKSCDLNLKNLGHLCLRHSDCSSGQQGWNPASCSTCMDLFQEADNGNKSTKSLILELFRKVQSRYRKMIDYPFLSEESQSFYRHWLPKAIPDTNEKSTPTTLAPPGTPSIQDEMITLCAGQPPLCASGLAFLSRFPTSPPSSRVCP